VSTYKEAGSGPHDSDRITGSGNATCGCKHDGLRWTDMCAAACAEWQTTHAAAALEHAKAVQS
jgi:hypothetical protein